MKKFDYYLKLSIKMIAASILVTVFALSYWFSQHYYDWHQYARTVNAQVSPMEYEGTRIMAQPWAIKVVSDRNYLRAWYLSIGHGTATAFIWTPWMRL